MHRLVLPLFALLLVGASDTSSLSQGVSLYRAGDYRAARIELLNAVRDEPANGAARLLQARVALALGDGGTAEGAIGQARALGVPAEATRHLMAEALVLDGEYDRALAEADPARVPARFAVYAARMRGRAHVALGELDVAGAEFAKAQAEAPNDPALWIDLARYRAAAGDLGGAMEASDRAVRLAPSSAEAIVLRGVMVRQQYGLVAALPWFDRALAVDSNNVPALLEAAATRGELGQASALLELTRRALSLEAGNPRAFYLQAVMAARAGDRALARSLMQRVGDRLGDLPGVLQLNGVLALDAGNAAQAAAAFERLTVVQPDNLEARTLLALAEWRDGDADGTIDALGPVADRADADRYALALMARAWERRGDRARAAAYLDRAGAAVRPGPAPMLPRADGDAAPAVTAIRIALGAGRLDQALALGEAQRGANPGAPAAHLLVGDILAAGGRYPDAARAYAAAASIVFSESIALRLVSAQGRAGDLVGARQTLALFLAQNPRNVPALMLAADLSLTEKRPELAIATLESLRTRLGNRDAALLAAMSQAYAMRGDGARAAAYAGAAYRLAPADPRMSDLYGRTLLAGDRRGALQLIEKAVMLAPDDPVLREHLADARRAVGSTRAAL